MADVDEIIYYLRTLKKGFDKELFQSKIDELSYLVETIGLHYKDFHTLFTVWLNMSIPIIKWVYLGSSLVPQETVRQNTVEYILKWILTNYGNMNNPSRVCFLLDWLTAAMETDSVDMNALDIGYELFCTLLTYESLSAHVVKLLYTLTKPSDVTRKRVLELIDLAKKREGKKNMFRQVQVLLGLFKSYKPQYVPEDVPSISIHAVFKSIDTTLLTRFRNSQNKRSTMNLETAQLSWAIPLNYKSGKNKADPLVPNVEFVDIGSHQCGNELQKTYLDFSDPVSLIHYISKHKMRRPARLRALLCNPVGLTSLVVASKWEQTFLSHDLHDLLKNCFLEVSPYSYVEKQDLLKRLAIFQATLLQGLPIVTTFLGQFLPFWNEKDFFAEILKLAEWVNVEDAENVQVIVDVLSKVYYRAQPLEQCAILNSVTMMYTGLVYASKRDNHYFLDMKFSETTFANTLQLVASRISDMSNKGIQISPESMFVMYGAVRASVQCARAEAYCDRRVAAIPRVLSLAVPLLSVSAVTIDSIAELLVLYKEIFAAAKAKNGRKDQHHVEQKLILKRYMLDFVNCFYEKFLIGRKNGIVFSKLHPQLVGKLNDLMPVVDTHLSIRNHLAFLPYTYVKMEGIDVRDANNKIWFHSVIEEEFHNLSQFVKQAMPELT